MMRQAGRWSYNYCTLSRTCAQRTRIAHRIWQLWVVEIVVVFFFNCWIFRMRLCIFFNFKKHKSEFCSWFHYFLRWSNICKVTATSWSLSTNNRRRRSICVWTFSRHSLATSVCATQRSKSCGKICFGWESFAWNGNRFCLRRNVCKDHPPSRMIFAFGQKSRNGLVPI